MRTKGYIPVDDMTKIVLGSCFQDYCVNFKEIPAHTKELAFDLVMHCYQDYFDKKEKEN